jgi:light-regulated signal transduction histidine kinase (bacteriophytochrome)
MQQLINDLLAFSRVGRVSADETTVFEADLALDRALRALADSIDDSGAVIEREPLPAVRGEQSLLAAVFQNLIANAIKFRRPDTAPRVAIGCRRDGEMWEFTCSDNGIGIDAEYAERIFMIFQRLHAKDIYPGTGIGLAMTRKIVEYHGGSIWLAPGDGSGSSFHFTLPALPEENHVPTR